MKRSTSYVMTVHVGSAGDMLELQRLRKTISTVNLHAKENEKIAYMNPRGAKFPRYYVKCQARGPRAKIARALGRYPRAFDQSLPLKYAERMDVYVYQR
tara:strand:+ start:222 stop:518 length:297 start_codon:yes stop_codon:yes gene_type:complete